MSLEQKLVSDLKEAMKSGEAGKVGVLRMVSAALRNKSIEKKSGGGTGELAESDVLEVVGKEAKKRRESILAFQQGNRPDLAEKEQQELKVLEIYLPKQLDESEVRQSVEKILVGLADKKNIGAAMKAVMAELKGKADSQLISKIVKEQLNLS